MSSGLQQLHQRGQTTETESMLRVAHIERLRFEVEFGLRYERETRQHLCHFGAVAI